MIFVRTSLLACTISLWLLQPSAAVVAQEVPKGSANIQAQSELDPHLKPAHRKFESPERFMLEVRGGPYTLFTGKPYGAYFKGDIGPNLGVQLDGIVYREERLFYITAGASLGFINFSGKATSVSTGESVDEETTLSIIPVTATVGIRFDALPRKLGIPLILGARLGWEFAHWTTDTGSRSEAAGWSVGPVVSGQLALDLDTFEPGGARALDEEWGINHSYVFFEVQHFF
ncbi:MAG: hypothetical protein RL701_3470, partial [Pseudomonadota bacterium]